MSRYYAGIGSRETPLDIQLIMTIIAKELSKSEFILRSGGAPGADSAFEAGADADNPDGVKSNKEIFLPWSGFNNKVSNFSRPTKEAFKIASNHHKAWLRLSLGAQKLMARNTHQIMGYDLKTYSEFVVCWTADGCESHETRVRDTGGTGQAIAIASTLDIPIFNLKNDDSLSRLSKHVDLDLESHINTILLG